MKKVLVTGAGGIIGLQTIKFLLSEGNYEITAIDLKNKTTQKALKKYNRRINIIYGDILNNVLMESLIKEHDFVIHLAGVMPPMANFKRNIAYLMDYKGTENIVSLISFYNPTCHLFYASSTTMYNQYNNITVNTKTKNDQDDYYSINKYNVEKLIKNKLKSFTIYRLPLVLSNPYKECFIYHMPYNTVIETVTKEDVGYLFARSIHYKEELKNKTYNVGGGTTCTDTYRNIIINILKYYGLSIKFILNRMFVEKNFTGGTYQDSDILDNIVHFRNDTLYSYYMRIKRSVKNKRKISRFLGKIVIKLLSKKEKLNNG